MPAVSPARAIRVAAVLALALAGVAASRLLVGPTGPGVPESGAVLEIRALRVALAATVGVSLAVAGALLQSLLRNPLASPELLGLSAGASLGVMIAAFAGHVAGMGYLTYAGRLGPAAVGAFGALGLVYLLSQRRGLIDPVALVLLGVIIAMMAGSGVMLLQSLMPDRGQSTMGLLVGQIYEDATWPLVLSVAAIALLGTAWAFAKGPAMDALAMSDDEARSVGVRVPAVHAVQFALAGVLTAGAVVLAGPVAFVGLVCPHAARLLGGPAHRGLVVNTALAGAVLLIGADLVTQAHLLIPADSAARRVLPLGVQVPIGVVTAMIGGPIFIALLRRSRLGPE